MSEEMWPVSGSITPAGFSTLGSKKSVAKRNGVAGWIIGIGILSPSFPWRSISPLNRLWPNRKADGGELVEIDGLTLGLVAGIARKCVRPEQVGKVEVVDDFLVLGDVELAGLLVELLVGPGGMFFLKLGGNAVVVAHEQGLQGPSVRRFRCHARRRSRTGFAWRRLAGRWPC